MVRKSSYRSGKIGFGGLLILLAGFLVLLIRSRASASVGQTQISLITNILINAGLNTQNAKFWCAISAFETNNWTSDIYVQNHNLFGMRLPYDDTTAVDERNGFAVFLSDSDSVKDLVMYFDRLNWEQLNFNSIPDLVSYMKAKNYFVEDETQYLQGVQARYNQLF